MSHARPHLTTHARGKGHSAIAGVAYRLGLRLYDKRTDTWHDYRRRALGEEVVAAFTLAPEGAPLWATDPAIVWDAVEAAEHRKDSQVAHDFRIPIPFGLTDADAEAMARSMAQHIVVDWNTVVSVGLHRDSPVDAMGLPKAPGKQGFHAHVYFPTRSLAFDAEAVRDADDEEQGGSDGWHFGEKLAAFSKKRAAAIVIDQLNQQWAALANEHTLMVGGVPDFTHLSYKRLGLDNVPQLRLGPSATAMERKGIATDKGDSLRQHQLQAERGTEDMPAVAVVGPSSEVVAPLGPSPVPMPASVPAAADGPQDERNDQAWLQPTDPIVVHRDATAVSTSQPSTEASPSPLAVQFFTALDGRPAVSPPSPEQQARLVRWLDRVERLLRVLARVAATLLDLGDRRQRDAEAWATFAVERDARRRERAEARKAAANWRAEHPWQLRLAAAMGGPSLKPASLVELDGVATSLDTEVQWLKRHMVEATDRVAELDQCIATAQAEQSTAHERLEGTLRRIVGLDPLYGPLLLSVSDAAHTPLLIQAMPVHVTDTAGFNPLDADPVLTQPAPGYRPELARSHRLSL